MAILKMGVVSPPSNNRICSVIAADLRFKVVCNSHCYNYSIHRNVVMAIVKVGVVSPPRNGRICYG